MRKTVVGQPPTNAPSADVTNGIIPLTVHFNAHAGDPDGTIRNYDWTFDDGTFSTNANPGKTFFTPGAYQVRLTVTDNSGNTVTKTIFVNATLPSATLSSPSYDQNQFQFLVDGATNLNHVVQGSADMTNWVALQTNRGPFTFVETNTAQYGLRFYRALSRP